MSRRSFDGAGPSGFVGPVNAANAAEWLQARIGAWPEIRILEHQERGRRFCTAGGEFLHFHGAVQMDVRLSARDRDRAIASGAARFHPRSHEAGWVIVPLNEASARSAIRLAAAAYRNRLTGCLNRSRSGACDASPRPCG